MRWLPPKELHSPFVLRIWPVISGRKRKPVTNSSLLCDSGDRKALKSGSAPGDDWPDSQARSGRHGCRLFRLQR